MVGWEILVWTLSEDKSPSSRTGRRRGGGEDKKMNIFRIPSPPKLPWVILSLFFLDLYLGKADAKLKTIALHYLSCGGGGEGGRGREGDKNDGQDTSFFFPSHRYKYLPAAFHLCCSLLTP